MNRRRFLTALALLPLAARAVHASPDRLLILVELKGGNDGLNTVVPFRQDAYYRLRPNLAIAPDTVLRLHGDLGLHPALESLLPFWRNGELAIVEGIGYPNQDYSHFRSIDIWDTASAADEYLDSGWLARTWMQFPPPRSYAADGVVIGSQDLGPMQGAGVRTLTLRGQGRIRADSGPIALASGNPALAHILKVRADIRHAAEHLELGHPFRTEFPATPFGATVKAACGVLANPQSVAAMKLSLGSFDTHANQLPTHARLLQQLAEGLAALKSGLNELGLWHDTLILTYSEFGRRPAENGNRGTDHGASAPHFILGGRVRGGRFGIAPDLEDLDKGNLRHSVDFRSVYATVLQDWLRLPAKEILGGSHGSLSFLRA